MTTTTMVPVGSLTDAELALLTRPRTRVGPRPVMPVWSRLDAERRTTAARRARAGLLARGLLDPDGPVGMRRGLRSLLALRGAAEAVVAVVRGTPSGRDHWYAHVTHEVVVVEQVSADGTHRFALTAAVTLFPLVAAAVLHPGARVAGADPPDAATDWLRSDVELRTVAGGRRWAWVSGPTGTWQLAPPPGLPPRPTAPADVRRLLREAVASLDLEEGDLSPVRPSGWGG